MDNAIYATLTRQSGLMQEMQNVANNLANASTTGFRKKQILFSEFMHQSATNGGSLSMANGNAYYHDLQQGALSQTGGTFDFAIEGSGFFLLETASGQVLTRAGNFTPNERGELASHDGALLLDVGGAPIFIPPDANSISLATDGTLSADGRPLAQVGLYEPGDESSLERLTGSRFGAEAGSIPVQGATILQGFLEGSNVNAINELTRMIEVQRAYELGQKFLEQEDERMRSVMQTIGR